MNNYPQNDVEYGKQQAGQGQLKQQQLSAEGGTSTGLILFLVGFLLAPCWWVGACCLSAQSIRTSQDHTWRTINRVMTVLSIIGLIAVIAWYIFVLVIFNKAMDTAMSAGTSIKKT